MKESKRTTAIFGSLRRAGALVRVTTFFVLLSYSSTLLAAGIPTNTLPTGANVTSGLAAVTRSNASMQVNQTTPNAIINWQQFNVGFQASVRFSQPYGLIEKNALLQEKSCE